MDLRQEIIRLALLTEGDKHQRAVNAPIHDIQEGEKLKNSAKEIIQEYNQTQATPISHTRVWLWHGETSGGRALTPGGRNSGGNCASPIIKNLFPPVVQAVLCK